MGSDGSEDQDGTFLSAAQQRRDAWKLSLEEELLRREDALPTVVRSANASARVKYAMVVSVADEILRSQEGFVACGKGCSHCCHMNVQISNVEAEKLQERSGKQKAKILRPVRHAHDEFKGVKCPFLGTAGECTVYESRPLACRTHTSFGVDDYGCLSVNMHRLTVPMVRMTGIVEAYAEVVGGRSGIVLADIRDFFPEQT